jgi:hypothetical protein
VEKKQPLNKVLIVILTVLAVGQAVLVGRAVSGPLKFFIPAGQSNMQAVALLDGVRIYNYAISKEDIQSLAN